MYKLLQIRNITKEKIKFNIYKKLSKSLMI